MTWEVTWSLVLGFTLSAVVQAVVRRSTVARLLGDDRPHALALSAGRGPASSCRAMHALAPRGFSLSPVHLLPPLRADALPLGLPGAHAPPVEPVPDQQSTAQCHADGTRRGQRTGQ